jgi:hypothetical protein
MATIHIIVSSKGGLGKTMTALSLVSRFLQAEHSVLAIDLNSTNPDLFRILARENPYNDANWIFSPLLNSSCIYRPSNPYWSSNTKFWDQIKSVVEHSKNAFSTVIVDTNLGMSNLISLNKETILKIKELLDTAPNSSIYLWNIWSFADLSRDNNIGYIAENLHGEFGTALNFIHVLNPYALAPSHVNLQSNLDTLSTLRIIDSNLTLIGKVFGGEVSEKLTNVSQNLDEIMLGRLGNPRLSNHIIPGFASLMHEDTVEYIEFKDFFNIANTIAGSSESKIFTLDSFNILASQVTEKFGGRPQNVLPISSFDPGLTGYIDEFAGSDIYASFDAIYNKLNYLIDDISLFLYGLNINKESFGLHNIAPKKLNEQSVSNNITKPDYLRPAKVASCIYCVIFCPKTITNISWCPIKIYILEEYAIDNVLADAEISLGESYNEYNQYIIRTEINLAHATPLHVNPSLANYQFYPLSMTVAWTGGWCCLDFKLRIYTNMISKIDFGNILFKEGNREFATIPISLFTQIELDNGKLKSSITNTSLAILPSSNELQIVTPKRKLKKPLLTIFASYSHLDKHIVERVEYSFRAIGLEYLRDMTSLKGGEHWSEGILRLIEEADIFQLFWSNNAAKSLQVKKEWQYALKIAEQKEVSFLRPIYWEENMPLPPTELEHIHFGYLHVT